MLMQKKKKKVSGHTRWDSYLGMLFYHFLHMTLLLHLPWTLPVSIKCWSCNLYKRTLQHITSVCKELRDGKPDFESFMAEVRPFDANMVINLMVLDFYLSTCISQTYTEQRDSFIRTQYQVVSSTVTVTCANRLLWLSDYVMTCFSIINIHMLQAVWL